MASISSSASLTTHLFKHDVFLSFSGEDTRHSFISHLHSALCRKSIKTFIDDELRRGEEISQGLLNAIEGSKFAVVVFSKGYAFSRWCLDELAKIVECIDTRGLKVIPVFYHVDPSDVRKQSGILAEAFAGHEANFNSNMEKLQRWRAALTRAANLSGWATQDCRLESAIVDGIVNCVWKDLQKMWPSFLKGLVGIGPSIEQLQTLLCGGSSDNVFILGIWGMGGIGKTTIARALFGQIKSQFERCCFLENVREVSEKRGFETLGETLLQKVLEERCIKINMADIQEFFYMLHDVKVLLVLDDVDDTKQLEYLAGDRGRFGPGTRIIITSRDRQVLKSLADEIYEVKALSYSCAIQVFSLHAFKHDVPKYDLRDLSQLVVGYANGVPLALKVLGSSLFGKSKKEWESSLKKLGNALHKGIQDVLRISCVGLDKEEKEIFLWIACHFNHLKKDYIIHLLDSCGFSTEIGLSILLNKSLLTVSKTGLIEMHDLLEEMGRELVCEESEDPAERSRLWNQKDIYQVFKKNSGTRKIKSIRLETSNMKEVQLHPDTFATMSNLQFLEIHDYDCLSKSKVHFPKGISGFPDELRILYWDGYSLKSLSENFDPENLICLHLPNNNIIELFHEGTQDLTKLRLIDLRGSQQLCKIHNLSQARHIRELYLTECPKFRSPDDFSDLKSLARLDLSGCSMLETFPKVPQSIVWLNLSATTIKEVPSELVECLENLVELHMRDCSQLKLLPTNIDLKSLVKLHFSGCSALKTFPEISKNLEELYLDKTAITQVPSSVACLSRLRRLSMKGCSELGILPSTIWKLQSPKGLRLDGCSSLAEFPQTIEEEEQQEENFFLDRLQYSSLSDCNPVKLPTDLGRLCSSLTELHLRENRFETFPSSIKQLSELKILDVSECKSLQSLPDLPPNLVRIMAYGCTSLETVGLTNLSFELDYFVQRYFNFAECFKLDHKGSVDVLHALMRNPQLSNFINENLYKADFKVPCSFKVIHTGSKIPGWFEYQSVGDSISFQLRPNWLDDGLWAFAIGFVYQPCSSAGCGESTFYYELHIGDFSFRRQTKLPQSTVLNGYGTETERLVLRFDRELYSVILKYAHVLTQSNHDVASMKFEFQRDLTCGCACKIKMWGVNPLYVREERYNTLQLLPLERPAKAACVNDRCPDADELGGKRGSSETGEEPHSERLKCQHQH